MRHSYKGMGASLILVFNIGGDIPLLMGRLEIHTHTRPFILPF